MKAYIIGHPAYTGANARAEVTSFTKAKKILIERGVAPEIADKKLREAFLSPYEHKAAETKDGLHVVEVYYKNQD